MKADPEHLRTGRAAKRKSGGALGFDAFCIFRFEISARQLEVMMDLEIHPEFRTIPEVQAQPERGVGGDAAPVIDDLGDTIRRDAERLRRP